jgi:uncharacterized protein YkwD
MKPVWIVFTAILAMVSNPAESKPRTTACQLMQRLVQEHANDMARREHLDHAGFMKRASRGARAENVAMGHSSKAKTIAQWWASPLHAANTLLPGCKGVAYAVSRSGRYYWAMEIAK